MGMRWLPDEFEIALKNYKKRIKMEHSIEVSDSVIFKGLAPKLERIMIKRKEKGKDWRFDFL